jgi:hemerythrin-like metal-binding protein
MHFEWDQKNSVHVAEIDQQHRQLFEMVNALDAAMRQGKSKDVLGKTLDDLIGYAGVHFACEEKYFEKFGYPEAEEHKREHMDFADKVLDLQKKFHQGKLGLSIEVMHFLMDWLETHTMGSDKKYSWLFNEKGLV